MTVDFICRVGCIQVFGANVVLGVSVRVILGDINMYIGGHRVTDCWPQCGGPYPISGRPD